MRWAKVFLLKLSLKISSVSLPALRCRLFFVNREYKYWLLRLFRQSVLVFCCGSLFATVLPHVASHRYYFINSLQTQSSLPLCGIIVAITAPGRWHCFEKRIVSVTVAPDHQRSAVLKSMDSLWRLVAFNAGIHRRRDAKQRHGVDFNATLCNAKSCNAKLCNAKLSQRKKR